MNGAFRRTIPALIFALAACDTSTHDAGDAVEPAVGPSTRTVAEHPEHGRRQAMWVTATAYCSRPEETQGDPFEGAWGDRLDPNVRSIAVSRNLLELGMDRGTRVWIEIDGREDGPWLVLDKMARRWTDRIDLYEGTDLDAARAWGRRRVRIHWSDDRPDARPPAGPGPDRERTGSPRS